MPESTYVENVRTTNEDEEEALIIPSLNFTRRDGNDMASDGRNDDGRTPGDPDLPPVVGRVSAAGVAGRRNRGSGDTLASGGSDGHTPGDPHAVLHPPINAGEATQTSTVECAECGYTFTPMAEKPLLLPTMPVANRRKPYLPPTDTDDSGDDDQRVGPYGEGLDEPPTHCPRCGSAL